MKYGVLHVEEERTQAGFLQKIHFASWFAWPRRVETYFLILSGCSFFLLFPRHPILQFSPQNALPPFSSPSFLRDETKLPWKLARLQIYQVFFAHQNKENRDWIISKRTGDIRRGERGVSRFIPAASWFLGRIQYTHHKIHQPHILSFIFTEELWKSLLDLNCNLQS